jgi:hypothetical protein
LGWSSGRGAGAVCTGWAPYCHAGGAYRAGWETVNGSSRRRNGSSFFDTKTINARNRTAMIATGATRITIQIKAVAPAWPTSRSDPLAWLAWSLALQTTGVGLGEAVGEGLALGGVHGTTNPTVRVL